MGYRSVGRTARERSLKSTGGTFRVPASGSPVRSLLWEAWPQRSGPDLDFSPTFFLFQAMTHVFSPYQINPFNLNPRKSVLSEVVDFDATSKVQQGAATFPLRHQCPHRQDKGV
jgi:hypothetical protein